MFDDDVNTMRMMRMRRHHRSLVDPSFVLQSLHQISLLLLLLLLKIYF
jgi:hypothetical protein